MINIKLIIAYDGTAYKGWQKTSMGPSIEETLQSVLEQVLQHPTPLQAASRTDAGVHARGQVVNFITDKETIDLPKLLVSVNCLLPKDIVVVHGELAAEKFHPTLDAKRKEYRYYICNGTVQLPHHRFYSWHYRYPLDKALMQQAANMLVGQHDFSSFCNQQKNANYNDYERNVDKIDILEIDENRFCISIQGSNFLYKMVRNLVGTILYVGREKIALNELPKILEAHDRTQAGITSPAHGLFLHSVFY